MFDALSLEETSVAPRKMVLSENAEATATDLAAALGGAEAALVMTEAALAEDWPQYVVARARTGGAFVVERAAMTEPAGALRLARGALAGRSAAALVVAGQLIFVLESETAQAQAA